MSHFALLNIRDDEEEEGVAKTDYQQQLTEAMLPRQAQTGTKILSFKNQCSVDSELDIKLLLFDAVVVHGC